MNGKETKHSKVANGKEGKQQVGGQNNKGSGGIVNTDQQGMDTGASVQKGDNGRINNPQRDKGGTSSSINLENSFGALGEDNNTEMIEQGKSITKQKQQSVQGDLK